MTNTKTSLDKDKIITNLRGKIDDQTLKRIRQLHPNIERCPTCSGRQKYVLEGVTYECDCEFQVLLQKHYFAANIGRAYHTLCFEHFIGDDSERLVTGIESYVDNWENNRHYGHGITFNGGLGTGKTFAMSLIIKELVKRGYRAYFITFDELINTMTAAWNNDEAKYLNITLRSVDVLGIDELKTDSRNNSGFLSDVAETIIRYRAVNLLPTLVTTNLTPTEEQSIFTKSYSLLSSLNTRVETHGEDVRGRVVREREHGMKERNERRPIC